VTDGPGTSRIGEARARAGTAKRALAATAAAGFLAAFVMARVAHPGQSGVSRSHASGATTTSGSSSSASTSSSFGFGGGSIAPSTSAPQVQTNVS
jgi:hypothetical protein